MAAVACSLGGCTAIFGLDTPHRVFIDAADDDALVKRDAGEDAPRDAPLDTSPDAPSACPSTYATAPNTLSRYRLGNQNMEWRQAAADCADDGATTHLAVLSNANELSGTTFLLGGARWIGLSDTKTEGTFITITAENTMGYPPTTGAPWGTGEPSAENAEVDCVLVDNGPVLKAESCTLNREFICECDTFANDPARYQ
jgi:hypothetical protein